MLRSTISHIASANRYLKTLRDNHLISDHKQMEPSKNGTHTIITHRKIRLTKVALDIIANYHSEKQVKGK